MINACSSLMNSFKWKRGANTAGKSKMKSRRQDEMDREETEGKGEEKVMD